MAADRGDADRGDRISGDAASDLTNELRDAARDPGAELPAGTGTGGAPPSLASNRYIIGIVGLVLCIVAVAAGLSTGSIVWTIVGAVILFAALGTVIWMTIGLTTEVEHPDPEVAASLEHEGVSDPDALLSGLAERHGTGNASADDVGRDRESTTPDRGRSREVGPGDG